MVYYDHIGYFIFYQEYFAKLKQNFIFLNGTCKHKQQKIMNAL